MSPDPSLPTSEKLPWPAPRLATQSGCRVSRTHILPSDRRHQNRSLPSRLGM